MEALVFIDKIVQMPILINYTEELDGCWNELISLLVFRRNTLIFIWVHLSQLVVGRRTNTFPIVRS